MPTDPIGPSADPATAGGTANAVSLSNINARATPLGVTGVYSGTGINPYAGGTGLDITGQGTGIANPSPEESNLQALKIKAQQQAAISAQTNQASQGDWRVRLSLAPGSDYLYNDSTPGGQQGILAPLKVTDGVIFPYTPDISTTYRATYSPYDLTHSNYRGYFYQNSYTDIINVRAVFTAQDTAEANYMLAVIHFFRSVTKMFYGQDAQAGSPPPLVFLSGLGEFQFNKHPCLVSQFNYTLPHDVDYIRARSPNQVNVNLNPLRPLTPSYTNPFFSSIQRMAAAFTTKGALPNIPSTTNLGLNSPTYVPTRIEIGLQLYPVQSRQQVSNQFSLQGFANGDLIKGGFW